MLVLDEPTAQLDPAGSRLVADALARLADGGASILIAEQKTDLLAAICQRVIVLADGEIALEGPAGEVLADPRLGALRVAAPAGVRLARAAEAAGLPDVQRTRLRQAVEA
jgi:energy-coupling factor transport system ATP-binding protein